MLCCARSLLPGSLSLFSPSGTLSRIRSLLLLYMSVDWDSPMVGADIGKDVLLDEVVAALEHVIEEVSEYQRVQPD